MEARSGVGRIVPSRHAGDLWIQGGFHCRQSGKRAAVVADRTAEEGGAAMRRLREAGATARSTASARWVAPVRDRSTPVCADGIARQAQTSRHLGDRQVREEQGEEARLGRRDGLGRRASLEKRLELSKRRDSSGASAPLPALETRHEHHRALVRRHALGGRRHPVGDGRDPLEERRPADWAGRRRVQIDDRCLARVPWRLRSSLAMTRSSTGRGNGLKR